MKQYNIERGEPYRARSMIRLSQTRPTHLMTLVVRRCKHVEQRILRGTNPNNNQVQTRLITSPRCPSQSRVCVIYVVGVSKTAGR